MAALLGLQRNPDRTRFQSIIEELVIESRLPHSFLLHRKWHMAPALSELQV